MAAITFSDVGVTLDGSRLFVSSASVSTSRSFEPVRSVGYNTPIAFVPSDPPSTSISLDCVGSAPPLKKGIDPSDPTEMGSAVEVGSISIDNTGSVGALQTSFSISVEPNAVVNCSAQYEFQGAPDGLGGALGGGIGGGGGGGGDEDLLHGGASGTGVGSLQSFSANYEMTQSFGSIFALGSMCPIYRYRTDGQETVTVEGDITEAVGTCSDSCPEKVPLAFSVATLCGDGGGFSASINGYATESGVSVSDGGVLTGNLTVTSFF